MKFLLYLFSILISVVILLGLIIIISPRYVEEIARFVIESSYFNNKYTIKIENLNLKFQDNEILLSRVKLYDKNISTSIKNLTIKYSFAEIMNFKIPLSIKGENCEIKLEDNHANKSIFVDNFFVEDNYVIFNNEHSGKFNINYTNKANTKGKFNYTKKLVQLEKCKYYSDSSKDLQVDFVLKKDDQGNFKSSIFKGFIQKLPLVQKELWFFLINDANTLNYLNNIVKNGEIFDSHWSIKLSSDFFKENKITPKDQVAGVLNIKNATILYDNEFAPLVNLNGKVILEKKHISLDVISASILNTKITNTKAILDYNRQKEIILSFSGAAEGPAIDLFNYIPTTSKTQLQNAGIIVNKFQGKAFTKFNVTIPLDMSIQNSYDITSSVKSDQLVINTDNVIKNVLLKLKVDSNSLNINLRGKFLDQPINADYNYVFNELVPFNNSLSMNMKILPNVDSFNDLRLVDIKEGVGNIALKLSFNQQYVGALSIHADLTKNTLFFNKIGLTKEASKKLIVKANSTLDNYAFKPINFNITGDDDLNIKGNLVIKDNSIWTFDHIKYLENNFKATIITSKDASKIDITGKSLDLSNIDLTQFITKQSDKANVTNIKVDNIKLKSNVNFEDFDFGIGCDKVKCNSGFMSTKVISKTDKPAYTTMILQSFEDYEMWTINTNNLGANMKAIGLYNNLSRGLAEFTIKSSRKEASLGELIPILDGQFKIRSFATSDMHFAFKFLTLTSLPGLINLIGDTSSIPFNRANGEFSFDGHKIKILNSNFDGPYFDFTAKGDIDMQKKIIQINGAIVPSLYGVNIVLRKFPLLGKLFSNGIVFAPYRHTINY